MSSRLLQILNPAHSAENVDDLFLENGRDRLQVLLTCYLFMPRLRLGNVGRHTCITIISDVRVLTLTHKSEPKNTVRNTAEEYSKVRAEEYSTFYTGV